MIQKVEVEGIDQLIRDFRHFGKEADKAIKRGVDRTALRIESVAKEKLASDGHRKTRRLFQSIHTETTNPQAPGMKSNLNYQYEYEGNSSSGSLKEKIRDDESIVGTNVHYAPDIEFGTRAHIIIAKNKKALHFKIGGKDIFVKSVNHPGTKASSFLGYAAVQQDKKLRDRIIEELNKLIKR